MYFMLYTIYCILYIVHKQKKKDEYTANIAPMGDGRLENPSCFFFKTKTDPASPFPF